MSWLARIAQWLFGQPSATEGERTREPRSTASEERPGTEDDSSAAGSAGRRTAAQPRPAERIEALTPGQFAPLSDDEVRRRASQVGSLGGNPWFGRRDLIPPASDARTKLIDQAMVGRGFLTAEELVEIHRVGEEMDAIRPDLAQAADEANRAVARDRQDRADVKAEKKRAAAERKRLRGDALARRRATDIVFLGRGVSKGLAERESNFDRLAQNGLPALSTPAEVAEALGVSIPRLRWLAFHSVAAERVHYVSFFVPKKNGGERRLSAPHRDLAACQDWIRTHILDKVPLHDAAHGFVRSRSTVTGAGRHIGRDLVLNVDLKDFFPSITFVRVKGVFQELGYSPAASTILGLLCTECPRRTVEYAGVRQHVAIGPRSLPQGASTSPALSNLVVRRLDARLTGIAGKLNWTYTRYADDLTFSAEGEETSLLPYLMARIRHIAEDEGFSLNAEKTRVQRPHTRQSVTGVVVNERAGVPRETVRRLRAILHRAQREGLAAQNRDQIPNFESWLRGMVAYVQMVNPQQGRPLQEALRTLAAGDAETRFYDT